MVCYFLLFISLLQVGMIGPFILLENRSPGRTITWLCLLTWFPFLGIVFYILFGRKTQGVLFRNKHLKNSFFDQTARYQQTALELDQSNLSKSIRLFLNSGLATLTLHNKVEILLNGGEKFTALLNALEGAHHHIHLSYYIFKDDKIGEDVLKILSRKAAEKVEVRVILDGVGSLSLSQKFMGKMREAGIQAEWFFPIRFPYLTSRLNLRFHRKIAVIDGQIGFMGGLNIGDEYLSRDKKLGFWRDTHLKIEGEAVHALQAVFLNDWHFITQHEFKGDCYFPKIAVSQNVPVQILASGPDSQWPAVLQSYFRGITMAKQSVSIETPYFIPDGSLIMALKTAALSGVDVRLIIQGIPEQRFTYWAMNSYLEELLKAGVKIYRYMKGILHAKIMIVDDYFASVGSANMDLRSFFLDFEINAVMFDQGINDELKHAFTEDLTESIQVTLEDFQNRSLTERMEESLARLFSPFL